VKTGKRYITGMGSFKKVFDTGPTGKERVRQLRKNMEPKTGKRGAYEAWRLTQGDKFQRWYPFDYDRLSTELRA